MIASDMEDPFPRTLVLGASGPIGRAMVRVATLERLPVYSASRGGDPAVDVTHVDQLDSVLTAVRPYAVVYLVRLRRVGKELSSEEFATHLSEVARHAAMRGVRRFVFASSAAVYGDRHPAPRRESDALEGGSAYALEKRAGEGMLENLAEVIDMSLASLRVFNVYGPGCRGSLLNSLVDGPRPSLSVTPNFVRDYVHVDDVAAAFLRAASLSDVMGPVNIGSGRAVNNALLAELCPHAYDIGDPDVSSWSVADAARAFEDLGWRPRWNPLDYVSPAGSRDRARL